MISIARLHQMCRGYAAPLVLDLLGRPGIRCPLWNAMLRGFRVAKEPHPGDHRTQRCAHGGLAGTVAPARAGHPADAIRSVPASDEAGTESVRKETSTQILSKSDHLLLSQYKSESRAELAPALLGWLRCYRRLASAELTACKENSSGSKCAPAHARNPLLELFPRPRLCLLVPMVKSCGERHSGQQTGSSWCRRDNITNPSPVLQGHWHPQQFPC